MNLVVDRQGRTKDAPDARSLRESAAVLVSMSFQVDLTYRKQGTGLVVATNRPRAVILVVPCAPREGGASTQILMLFNRIKERVGGTRGLYEFELPPGRPSEADGDFGVRGQSGESLSWLGAGQAEDARAVPLHSGTGGVRKHCGEF